MGTEYDILAKKYFGEDYRLISYHDQLKYFIDNLGLPSIMAKDLYLGAKTLDDDEAKQIAHDFMEISESLSRITESRLERLANKE